MKTALRRLLAAALILGLTACAVAPEKQRITRADELPRFSYPVEGDLIALLRDDSRFRLLSAQIARNHTDVLARYDIAEKATQRSYLGLLVQMALIDGRYGDALQLTDRINLLQEKPADKLMSGLLTRAIIGAAQQRGERESPAYRQEVARRLRANLDTLPFLVVRNDIMRAKASAEFMGESLTLGRVREVLQPVADKTGRLSSSMAPSLVSARYALDFMLPLKDTLIQTYGDYLKANQVDKPDIWALRDVALPEGRGYAPVTVAVWDSGVDMSLFANRLAMAEGQPAFIAFDRESRPSLSPMLPIAAQAKAQLPVMQARSKGLSDAQSNIESAEATEVKRYLSGLKPGEYKAAQEAMRLNGNYQHGTHVAGIAMAGNPYARLLNARIEFGHTLTPNPCPSRELEERASANFHSYVNFIRQHKVRVVNMSWSGNVRSYETALEQCNIGKDSAERKALARVYFQLHFDALRAAIASAPEVLFVAAAGNSANDPSFNETYPSSIVLPNLITVGAVDKAGDEAAFTSYGPTVAVHANGYQVESFVPGGARIALSGTSMAAPQVANIASKLIAINPLLTGAEAIKIIISTAEKTADGRRVLIHPGKALQAVGYHP